MISPLRNLKESRESLSAAVHRRGEPYPTTSLTTGAVDHYFQESFQGSRVGSLLFNKNIPFAIVAVGGYGRRELCLHSDIDIMVLFQKKVPSMARDLIGEIIYPLWDLGLDLGYAVRTIRECMDLSRKDFQVLTSLLDTRFICGESTLYLQWKERLEKKVLSARAAALTKWLMEQGKIRLVTFGDASYLLEPNLKEGIGGLRDYHCMLWLSKAFSSIGTIRKRGYPEILTVREHEELRRQVDFMHLVRNLLHMLSGRKNDRLFFEYQEEIAKRIGFRDLRGHLAVEQFMGRLHGSMMSIKTLYRSFLSHQALNYGGKKRTPHAEKVIEGGIRVVGGELDFVSKDRVLSNPYLLTKIFELISLEGFPLTLEAKRMVKDLLFLVDETSRRSRKSILSFLNIIYGKRAFDALEHMLETGFLSAFIPEFGAICNRVQFGGFHIYPVGTHLLHTLKHLKEINRERDLLLFQIFSDLPNPQPLLIAALFHDIGKTGPNHSKRGERMKSPMPCSP